MNRLSTILVGIPLLAHDLYLMPERFVVPSSARLKVAFHNGDGFPDSQVAPRVERMIEPRVLSASGSVAMRDIHPDGKVLIGEITVPNSGNVIVAVNSKPNGIELAPTEFEKYLKHEGLIHVIQWRENHSEATQPGRERYSKYVKSILLSGQPSDFYNRAIGYPIEIIPEKNPYVLKPGDFLPVQVLFRGKPASDLQIEMAWLPPGGKAEIKTAGRTGTDGRLVIPIGARGIWKLHTVLMERCAEPAVADWESFWSSVTFEIQ